MAVTLEWVQMPNGVYFCTICENGIPIPEPTEYLLLYVYPGYGSTRTVRSYGQWLLPFFKWLNRQVIDLRELTRLDIERFRRDLTLIDMTTVPLLRKGANSAQSTTHHIIAITLRFISWAMELHGAEPLLQKSNQHVRRRNVSFLRLTKEDIFSLGDIVPRQKRILPKYLTQYQLNVCREWIMDTYSFDLKLQVRNRAIFEVMWDGALRKGSLLGLCLKNINWIERTILVSSDQKDYHDAWFCKRENPRTAKTGEYMVIVADQTLLWLDRYRQETRPVEAIRLGHAVFFCEHGGRDHGHPLRVETLKYFFESMSRSRELGGTGIHVTPHMLRHTWATMAEDDELPIEVIQHQLGHAHISTTELYSHVAPEKRRQSMKQWRESHPERYKETI